MYGDEPVTVRRKRMLAGPPCKAPAAARYLIHRPLPPEELSELFGTPGGEVQDYLSSVDALYRQCSEWATDLDRMQEVMLHTFLSENICCFADAMAMDSSAELRMPFLDRDLVEFVFSLPVHMRVSRWPGRANTKLILRWWARNRLPQAIVRQRKRTFPFGTLPGLLATHGDKLRGFVLGSSAVRRHLPGLETWLARDPASFRSSREGTLWALLALGIWAERVALS
jgi:asparagine synthase (glutamine-hydrolysing)